VARKTGRRSLTGVRPANRIRRPGPHPPSIEVPRECRRRRCACPPVVRPPGGHSSSAAWLLPVGWTAVRNAQRGRAGARSACWHRRCPPRVVPAWWTC